MYRKSIRRSAAGFFLPLGMLVFRAYWIDLGVHVGVGLELSRLDVDWASAWPSVGSVGRHHAPDRGP